MKSIKTLFAMWLLFSTISCFGDNANTTNWWRSYEQDLLNRTALLQTTNVGVTNVIHIFSETVTNGLRAHGAASAPDLRALRELETTLLLLCIVRLDQELDKAWNPKDLPRINVPAPAGVPLPPGASPNDIKDPALRREYESAIATENAKAKRYKAQRELHLLIEPILEKARNYVSSAYTRNEQSYVELERLFAKCQVDSDTRSAILRNLK